MTSIAPKRNMSQIDPRLASTSHSQQQTNQQAQQAGYGPYSPPLPRIRPANELPYSTPTQQQHQPAQVVQSAFYTASPGNAVEKSTYGHSTRSPQSGPPSSLSRDAFYIDQGSPGDGHDPNDLKRPRACEACRSLKVRCDPDPSNDPNAPCKRCAKAKRQCITTAPSRKRQKKTDSRVAELEKKIDALTASLHAQGATTVSTRGFPIPEAVHTTSAHGSRPPSPFENRYLLLDNQRPAEVNGSQEQAISSSDRLTARKRKAEGPSVHVERRRDLGADIPCLGSTDLSERIDTILDAEHATRIFEHYLDDMVRHIPVVAFTAGTPAESVRKTKPILFLSIITAASVGMLDVERQQKLHTMLLGIFADCIVRNGEKSMELVQALCIATIWYRPPKRFERMNFYQLNHIAAVMALDIGMGKKLHQSKAWRMGITGDQLKQKHVLNADMLEARRTWLGCYYLCANTAMSLRRPNLVRWTGYMDECIQLLETAPGALPTDRILCQHVKLQHLNEDIATQFCMDDPTANIAITDQSIQIGIKQFEKGLREWEQQMPKYTMNPVLEFSKHTCALFMHEVALHIDHNIDDFRAPFTEESLRASSGNSAVVSQAHSSALGACVEAAHGMFRTFQAFDLNTMRSLPVIFFVRTAYAVVAMIKLHFAVTAPDSQVGKIISKDDLDVEGHLDRLLIAFRKLGGVENFRPANKFLVILGRLREWFCKNRDFKPTTNQKSTFNPWAAAQAADEALQDAQRPGAEKTLEAPRDNSASSQQSFTSAQRKREYNQRTPLHFLSDVATNPTSAAPAQTQYPDQYPSHQPQYQPHQTSTQQGWESSPSANVSGYPAPGLVDANGNILMELGTGFEQAIDMALGGGDASDLTALFMGNDDWLQSGPELSGGSWDSVAPQSTW